MCRPVLVVLLMCLTEVVCAVDDGSALQVNLELAPGTRILNRTVEEWVERLKGTEIEEERKLAMFCLAEFGPAAAGAVPELLAVSRDEFQPENQRWAAVTLGAIGPAAKTAVPHLLTLLGDTAKPAAYRAAACAALPQIDPQDSHVRRAVLAAVRDKDRDVRVEAFDAAVTLAPHDPGALAALSRALLVTEDARPAASALLCMGEPGIDALSKVLERAPEATRAAAAEALGCIGPTAARTLPVLLKALKRERDGKVQATMTLAAARIAPRDAAVLEVLAERLELLGDKKEHEMQATETRVLMAAGEAGVPALRNALHSRGDRVRLLAVQILSKLPASPDIVRDLVARAQDKDASVRQAAIKALDAYGPAAADARNALNAVAQSEQDPEIRRLAELAALNVARVAGTPRHRSTLESRPDAELVTLLRDPAPAIRQEAAEVLRTRTEDSASVATALVEALDDLDERVRVAAARSLVRFGKYARVALGKLTEWLESDNADVRKAALAALAGMGADAKPALPAIVATATSPSIEDDKELAKFVSIVLRAIGPDAVPALVAELKSEDAKMRARAARALGAMEAVAATAVPDLIELSKSAVDSDGEAGFAALQAIGPVAYHMSVEYLVRTLRGDSFAERRKWAARAFWDIKAPDETSRALEALSMALLDEDDSVCRAAHGALARIGSPALPKLREMLKLGEGEAPYWAVRVLARMKADPEEVIPRLIELTQPGKRPVERGTAAELMGEYAPARPEIIPPLLRVLADREDYVARPAIASLAPFGEKVIEPLKDLLRQRNPLLRRRALEALAAVRTRLETQ